jgi:acetoin utilization deacetylase AcuC-like enzyme
MLLHSLDCGDEKNEMNHVENPARLRSIIKHLEETGLVKKCELINSFEPKDVEKFIELCHGESYIEYVRGLWSEMVAGKKSSMKFGDTYYNENSSRAADLSAEALKICVDKVFNGEWKNAYAAVRPPGHHAGVNGKISGFCFYNSVACAAKYAQK